MTPGIALGVRLRADLLFLRWVLLLLLRRFAPACAEATLEDREATPISPTEYESRASAAGKYFKECGVS